MIKFSNWYFKDFTEIDDVINVLNRNKEHIIKMDWDERDLKNAIINIDGFDINSKREIEVDGEKIEHIYFRVRIEYAKKIWSKDDSLEDRMNWFEENILIYKDKTKIKLIILSSKTHASSIIKKFFKESIWGEIIEDNNIDKDLLYWMFYRLREYKNDELMNGCKLYLTGLVSYMGKSKDEINAIRGQGVRVGALLGTLAFIFNDDNLKALKPEIQYKDHILVSELKFNNGNKISDANYVGSLMRYNDDEKVIALTILMCRKILPTIVEAYNESKVRGEWTAHVKLSFLRNIGNVIDENVQAQLKKIQDEIKELENSEEEEDDDLVYSIVDEQIELELENELDELEE
ncbi:hypothetical protein ACFO6R_08420 [Eubacterium multiforme]|uniref:Uncharacterized protein n=1 Tax=Eubacterium multiforme TaxID=83339 RepID=A0ABT9UUP7_9FIRM|nr:hypothetical protein [Eubacterium multiforme]MDQ0150027.1 hypothetical protein [Eubacterium multiforme]